MAQKPSASLVFVAELVPAAATSSSSAVPSRSFALADAVRNGLVRRRANVPQSGANAKSDNNIKSMPLWEHQRLIANKATPEATKRALLIIGIRCGRCKRITDNCGGEYMDLRRRWGV